MLLLIRIHFLINLRLVLKRILIDLLLKMAKSQIILFLNGKRKIVLAKMFYQKIDGIFLKRTIEESGILIVNINKGLVRVCCMQYRF